MIRLGAERAREICSADHPFSSQRFRSDGRMIFAETIDGAGEPKLLDLVKSQFAFARVIGPSLYAGIEFSDRDMPVRWWPLGRQTPVVIDPGPQLWPADRQRRRHPHSRPRRCGRG